MNVSWCIAVPLVRTTSADPCIPNQGRRQWEAGRVGRPRGGHLSETFFFLLEYLGYNLLVLEDFEEK